MSHAANSGFSESKVERLVKEGAIRERPLSIDPKELEILDTVISISQKRKGQVAKQPPKRKHQTHSSAQPSPAEQFSGVTAQSKDLGAFTSFNNLLASLPMGIIGIDEEGLISFWSNGRQQAFNKPSKVDVGRPIEVVLARMARHYQAPGLVGLGGLIRTALKDGTATSGWQFELHSNGQASLIQADFSPLHKETDDAAGGGLLLLQDVTARERAKDGSREIGYLSSLGELAASVAHEVRNPLSAVKAAAQFLVQENSADELVTHYAGIIDREAARLEKLVRDFLSYAKPPSQQINPISVDEVVNNCCELLEREAANLGIKLEYRQKGELPIISADSASLTQALLNLGKNALEAAGEGGKVSFITSWKGQEKPIEITVRDTGCGITRKNLARVLDPFFSTKPSGTGLGLPIAKRIIELQGGSISLISRPGRGTRVAVTLPVSRSEDASR